MTDSTIRSTPASAPASMPDSTPASAPHSTPASTTDPIQIEATPFAYRFAPGRTALVVIDMQRDFIEPGGFGESLGNDVGRLQPAIAPIARLLAAWRALGWPIVHTRESHRADLSDCPPAKRLRGEPLQRIGEPGPMGRLLIRGEPGTSIIDELQPREGEIVVDKPGKGMFWATGLQETLQAQGVSHLVFTGVTTEVCVQTSMREANDRGYDCLLVEDATESYFPAFKTATLAMIAAQGAIVGWHAPSETLLKSLVMDPGRPSGSGSASPGVADPPRG